MKIVLLAMFSFIICSCRPDIVTKGNYTMENTGGWSIPITIHGKTYPFLFDTGSSASLISEELANEIGLPITDSLSGLFALKSKIAQFYCRGKVHFKINEFCFSNTFYTIQDTVTYNIIGMDFIQNFYWLFNQKDTSFILSSNSIKADILRTDKTTHLKYRKGSLDEPLLDLIINDSVPITLAFDTGLCYKNSEEAKIIAPTIHLLLDGSDSLFAEYVYHSYKDYVFFFHHQPFYLFAIQSMKINDLSPMKFILKIESNSVFKEDVSKGTIGLLGLRFVEQYREMYLDPFRQEISFYASPQDSFVYNGKNVDYLIEESQPEREKLKKIKKANWGQFLDKK